CTSFALITLLTGDAAAKDDPRDALWAAVRNSDAKAVAAALDAGADVNAKNEIGITALWIATSKIKPEVIQLLVRRGADVNARDGIWYQTPLSNVVSRGNEEIARFLIQSGAKDIDANVVLAAGTGRAGILKVLLEAAKPSQEALDAALFAAPAMNEKI